MRSRRILLKSCISSTYCPFQRHLTSTYQDEKESLESVPKNVAEETFVEEFISGKRRYKGSLSKASCKRQEIYLKKSVLEKLIKHNQALSVSMLGELIVSELLLHILLENGMCLYYLRTIPGYDHTNIHRADLKELKSCHKLRNLLQQKHQPSLLPSINIDIIGRTYSVLAEYLKENTEVLEQQINELQEMEKRDQLVYYFEILYDCLYSYTKFFYECQRRTLLLKCMLRRSLLDKSPHLMPECLIVADEFLRYMNKNQNIMFGWLALPSFYAQCAKVYCVCGNDDYVRKGVELYQNVIEIDKRGQNTWTRYLWKGYYGQMQCFIKLDEPLKAQEICIRLTEKKNGIYHLIPSRTSAYMRCGRIMREGEANM